MYREDQMSFTKVYRWVTKFNTKLKQDAAYPGHPVINNNNQQKRNIHKILDLLPKDARYRETLIV